MLVEVGFRPSIGLLGADKSINWTQKDFSSIQRVCRVHLRVFGRWKLFGVEKKGALLQLPGTCGISGRNRLEAEAPRAGDIELMLFFPCMQTHESSHTISAPVYITFDF